MKNTQDFVTWRLKKKRTHTGMGKPPGGGCLRQAPHHRHEIGPKKQKTVAA
jgi:hypothetical protein